MDYDLSVVRCILHFPRGLVEYSVDDCFHGLGFLRTIDDLMDVAVVCRVHSGVFCLTIAFMVLASSASLPQSELSGACCAG